VNAFDARPYAPSGAPSASEELALLGERLFGDPALSGDGTRSCASCHNPGKAFADGLPRATSLAGRGHFVARNTPTLINAALQPIQFSDGRSPTLEDQVLEVLRSPAEMGSSVEIATDAVRRILSYRSAFARAFGDTSNGAVTSLRLRQALAAFVRTLESLNSPFDRAVRGDTNAMTSDERRGFTLFMGKARCGTCHFAPLFSGNTPPLYIGSDVEVIGTPATVAAPTRLDPDSGRAGIDHLPVHLRAFKTPSLRNVALTAPYMHNGAFRTLDDVVTFYDHGGGRGAGAPIANQTLEADSLRLSTSERRILIAFLGALTDTAAAGRGSPARPRK
jgi:cytochrome c peroxidase